MKRDWLDWSALVLAVAIITFVLFIPPVVGLADEGDFVKIMGKFDLYLPQGQANGFADTTYAIDPNHHWDSGVYSSEALLGRIAAGLNRIFRKDKFDIRWMGAVHGGLYLLAFWLAMPLFCGLPRWRRMVLLGAIILILGDINYVSALNSFYMDTAAWIFTCLTAVFYFRALAWKKTVDRAALLLSLVLWITAKTQHSLTACVALILILFTWRELEFNRTCIIATVATGISAIALLRAGTPAETAAIPCFNVIFYGILPHSRNVHSDLAQLGLDDSYAKWIGMFSYSAGGPMNQQDFVKTFNQRTGHGTLALYFLRHPGLAWPIMRDAISEAGRQRPYLGNYDRGTGAPEFQMSGTFSLWSRLKEAAFYHHGVLYLGYTFLLIAILVVLAGKHLVLPAIAYSIILLVELLIFSLGDVLDTLRHAYVFNAMTDLAIVSIVGLALGRRVQTGAALSRL